MELDDEAFIVGLTVGIPSEGELRAIETYYDEWILKERAGDASVENMARGCLLAEAVPSLIAAVRQLRRSSADDGPSLTPEV